MSDAPLMLGVSGLRGIVGKSLTPEVAVRYASAVGGWLSEHTGRKPYVLLGRDGRHGGESVYFAAAAGLMSAGCRVRRLGVLTTPTMGVAVDTARADAAVIVTASHNPQEWNGLKLLVREQSWQAESAGYGNPETADSDACAPSQRMADEIIGRYQSDQRRHVASVEQARSTGAGSEDDAHCLRVLQACEEEFGFENYWSAIEKRKQYGVVADSVNASSVVIDEVFYEDSGCRFTQIAGQQSGMFPHTPEPTRENLGELMRAVRGLGADIGFAQDPDADRLAIVDERGEYIGEEYTLALAAESLLSAAKPSKKPRVLVANLSTSRMIDDIATAHGARVVRTPVGEANVVEAMKREKAAGHDVVLGGEGNGGVIWPKVTYVRDSLSAMALVLALMARTGKKVSELVAAIPAYAIEKRKVDLARKEDARPAIEKIAAAYRDQRVDLQDGVRIDWPRAWLHVRASNTEPIMRLIAESPSADESRRILDEAARVIAG
jgi:phosphomannomutase